MHTAPTVVGYQNQNSKGGVRFATTTFCKISGARTLGDFVPVSVGGASVLDSATFYVTFYDNRGAQRQVKKDAWLVANKPDLVAEYGDEVMMIFYNTDTEDDKQVGWYLTIDDRDCFYQLNDYPLNDGDGFLVYASSDHTQGVNLTSSGQVSNQDIPVVVVNGVAFFGNMMPSDWTLSDFTVTSRAGAMLDSATFYVTFYDERGAQRQVKKDAWLVANKPDLVAEYGDEVMMIFYNTDTEDDKQVGWYLTIDDRDCAYPLNDYPVKAGDGFLMYAGSDHGTSGDNAGVELKIPTPIPAEK